jgi:hypothetical protein
MNEEGYDGCGEGKEWKGVKEINKDGIKLLIKWKMFCVKEMNFNYLNIEKYLIIFLIKLI